MTPQLVVGMPVYNGERFLPLALADLSAQRFPDMRILISDNASTDSTPDILSDFAARDSRIVFHRQAENIGPIRNYEWTLRNSDSPYFAFAAFDDGWSPGYFDALMGQILARPETLLSVPAVTMMDMDGVKHESYPFTEAINAAAGLARVRLCLRHITPSWFHGVFRRDAFVKSWDSSRAFPHVWGIDPVILLPFLLSGQVSGSNDAVFYRRVTGSSDEKYRPHTAVAQARLTRDFYIQCLKILNAAPLTATEKAALLPDIFSYGRYGGRIRRVLKLFLKGKLA